MVSLVMIVLITGLVAFIGGGAGYLFYLKTRPKKQTWKARVYQLGDGEIPPTKDRNGNLLRKIKLRSLIPFAKDTIELQQRKNQQDIYRLQGLKKTVPAVTSGVVEYWGEGQKEVSVLMQENSCTLMKKGYDIETGEVIFDPLPYPRMTLIKQEITERKTRISDNKDILQAIAPWIIVGILMLSTIAITYINISGYIEVANKQQETVEVHASTTLRLEELRRGAPIQTNPLGPQLNNTT